MSASLTDGDASLFRGMNSVRDRRTLSPSSYPTAINMLNRGGMLKSRPGFKLKFTLPAGNLQALKVFTPRKGHEALVAFVDGVGYLSVYPYRTYRKIPFDGTGETPFSPNSNFVYAANATRAVTRNVDGSLRYIQPENHLMLNDGVSTPKHFDGAFIRDIRGSRKTPVGTHMAWCGARLWVARNEKVFASDIADPFSFAEQETNTLGGLAYFLLSGNCTGLVRLPGANTTARSPLIAFTEGDTTLFRADILPREEWAATLDFQNTIFPDMGCVSHLSFSVINGVLWWMAQFGYTQMDAAAAAYQHSKLADMDKEMAASSTRLKKDLSGVSATSYENFLLVSVPFESKRNVHTWVFDDSPLQDREIDAPACWASIWTGVAPKEWVTIGQRGHTRVFCASQDSDGNNRVYETFTPERRDSDCDFPWEFVSRGYTANTSARKQLRWADLSLDDLTGTVDVAVDWAGAQRGPWKRWATRRFIATEGNLDNDRVFNYEDVMFGFKGQNRSFRTQDLIELPQDEFSSAGIEGNISTVGTEKEAIDSAFQVRISGSGPVAISSLQVFMDPVEAQFHNGQPDEVETEEHFVRTDGAAAKDGRDLDDAPSVFTSVASVKVGHYHIEAVGEATVQGQVSQLETDKRAQQVAAARAELRTIKNGAIYRGGSAVQP